MSRDFNGSYVRKAGLICGFLIVIAASNFISYRSAVKKLEKMSQKSETYITSQMKDYTDAKVKQYYNKIKDSSGSESVTAGTKNNDKLTVQTIYQVEKYDSAKDISSAEYRNLPEKLVGMNKEQVEAYCHDYMNNMSADEFLAGLQSMGVVSFSSDRLVIKKIYDQTKIKYKYYLIAIDGEVVVYYGDKKTIVWNSPYGICAYSRSQSQYLNGTNGDYMLNEGEIYQMLNTMGVPIEMVPNSQKQD